MTRLDEKMAYEALMDTPVFAEGRIPTHALDFGDEATVTLSLKRRNDNVFEGNPNDKFGLFLGNFKGKFVVGVHNLGNKLSFNATEVFETVEEMQSKWQLD